MRYVHQAAPLFVELADGVVLLKLHSKGSRCICCVAWHKKSEFGVQARCGNLSHDSSVVWRCASIYMALRSLSFSPRLPTKHRCRHSPCGFSDVKKSTLVARGGAGMIPYQLGHDSRDSDFSLYIAYVSAARLALEDPLVDRPGSPAFRRIEELVQACRNWASMHVRPVSRATHAYTSCTTATARGAFSTHAYGTCCTHSAIRWHSFRPSHFRSVCLRCLSLLPSCPG